MGSTLRRAYCGASRIISSLGQTTAQNRAGVESYATNIQKFRDGTPVCLIDRDTIDTDGLESYTFAEQLSIVALREIGVRFDDNRTLLIISTTKGNIDCIKEDFERSQLWALANQLQNHFNLAVKPMIISNACVSGVAAVIVASRLVEHNEYDNVVVLGVDVVSEFVVSGFNSFKSISPTICRPYDSSRDGLTLGEGCAALLVSSSESSIIISGGAMSDDANHISGPSRTGDGLAFAISAAMSEAGITPSEVSFVNAHGTATAFNDEMESRALELTSLTATPCNSLKPYIGHTLGASGVIELILCIEQLATNRIFGVKGYSNCGTPHKLNVAATHRDMELTHCLKTASGFGGTNAAVVLSKIPSPKTQNKTTNISQISEVHIAKADAPFAEYIRAEYRALAESNMKFFKMDNLSKLGYVASCKLMKGVELDYPRERIGVVLANRNSSLDTDLNHQSIVDQQLEEGASPAVFVYTLANIAAAEIAIKHKFQGESIVFVDEQKDMESLLNYSRKLIQEDRCDAVLYGWCDLLGEDYEAELKLIVKQ